MGVAMDLHTTVAGSAILDSVGMGGLAGFGGGGFHEGGVHGGGGGFHGVVTGNPVRQFDPSRGA
jgi:hypothetical protein